MEWFVLAFVLFIGCTNANDTNAGPLYAFGLIGVKTNPLKLNSDTRAFFLENNDVRFSTVAAGTNSVAVVFPENGTAASFKDPVDPAFTLPSQEPEGQGFCSICKGSFHTVAVSCYGDLFTWGARSGLKDPEGPMRPPYEPVRLDVNGERVIEIACGENHTLILTEDRNVYAFGQSSYGRLGLDVNSDEIVRVNDPVQLPSLTKESLQNDPICHITAGGKSSFAITESGKMYVWGANDQGQLGTGIVSDQVVAPQLVDSPIHACDVAAAQEFTIASDDQGDFWSWGAGEPKPVRFGQAPSVQSFFSIFEPRISQVAAGQFHAAILTDGGNVVTYGYNRFGQLGYEIDAAFTEKDPESDLEPDSPIWTLNPRVVEGLRNKEIASIFANGNYTLAQAYVKSPFNCPCARGGRTPTKLKTTDQTPNPSPQLVQPMMPPSDFYEPVAPFIGRKLAVSTALPGEEQQTTKRLMTEVSPSAMYETSKAPRPELPVRPATFFYYPEDTIDSRVFEETGAVTKGQELTLFGRHVAADGSFYGDYDEEVASDQYTRMALMPSSGVRKMPEAGESADMTTSAQADRETGAKSLSLQDGRAPRNRGDAEMLKSSLKSLTELQDTFQPVDFELAAKGGVDFGDEEVYEMKNNPQPEYYEDVAKPSRSNSTPKPL
eukprot:c25324_g1_i1.p1 GENE.c25324_g1_i1~~c25324_g1_i1.p1  ORF type:complete len:662 (+),score=114.62 c25324_g1_i1:30-2015(+)